MKKQILLFAFILSAAILITALSSCTDQADVTTEPLPESSPILSSDRPLSRGAEQSSLEEPSQTPSYAPEKEYPELPSSVLTMIWGDSIAFDENLTVFNESLWDIRITCAEKPSEYFFNQKELLESYGYKKTPYIALCIYLDKADPLSEGKNCSSWREELRDLTQREAALSGLVNAEDPKAESYTDGFLTCYFEEGIFQKDKATADLTDLTSQKEKARQQVVALAEEIEQKYVALADQLKTTCPYVFVKRDTYFGSYYEDLPYPALFLFATEKELLAIDPELKCSFTASFCYSAQYGIDMNAVYNNEPVTN